MWTKVREALAILWFAGAGRQKRRKKLRIVCICMLWAVPVSSSFASRRSPTIVLFFHLFLPDSREIVSPQFLYLDISRVGRPILRIFAENRFCRLYSINDAATRYIFLSIFYFNLINKFAISPPR